MTDAKINIGSVVFDDGSNVTGMSVWTGFYQWCEDNDIPITNIQKAWIKQYRPVPMPQNTPPENLAYFLTEHFENISWPEMPDNIKEIILKDKVSRMKEWGWPSWGFKDVMYLKNDLQPEKL